MVKKGKKSTAKQVRSNTAKINRIKSSVEKKFVEADVSLFDVNTTGVVVPLSLVAATGSGLTTDREGEKITTRRMMIRGAFYNNNSSGTPEDCIIRMIIFRRKDVSGTLPSASTLLSQASYRGFMFKDHMHDYVIYYDTTFSMDTSLKTILPFKWMKRFNMNVRYNATGGAITELEANGLFVWFYSTVAGTTDCPQAEFRYRHDFVDL